MSRGARFVDPILAVTVGLFIGILVSWWIAPNTKVDSTPAGLHPAYQEEYRLLVATSYGISHNLDRARSRLSLLNDIDQAKALINLALKIRSGQFISSIFPAIKDVVVYDLAFLAYDLELPPPTPELESAGTSRPTGMLPTRTYLPFTLLSRQAVCNEFSRDTLARIQVKDSLEQQIPDLEILVTWEGGQQRFFTGFKPEMGMGYADFIMDPGIIYTIQIPPPNLALIGLKAPDCQSNDGTIYTGGVLLVFQQP